MQSADATIACTHVGDPVTELRRCSRHDTNKGFALTRATGWCNWASRLCWSLGRDSSFGLDNSFLQQERQMAKKGCGIRTFITASAASAILAFTLGASAEAAIRWPANGCLAANSTSLGKLTYDGSGVWNSSGSGTAQVWCPISRDLLLETARSVAYVRYVDNSSSFNLTCNHYWNEDSDGAPYWSQTRTSSGSGGAGFFVIDEEDLFYGQKSWRCSLPASSSVWITSYEYDQFP